MMSTRAAFVLFIFPYMTSAHSFTIDYNNNTFIKDGIPYRYISGSMHYFRIPKEYWKDRLLKLKTGGLTAVQTYVEWSSHQPTPNTTDFSGNLDIETYLQTASDLGLDVILRPGPYIDAERDLGGLPYWLLQDPNIKLRTRDPRFLEPVTTWFKILFSKLSKYLYKNGGPIVMIQVENEYGSYAVQTNNCDKVYLGKLRDLTRELVGPNVQLFTTDGASVELVTCGKIPEVYATVDFGPGSDIAAAFQVQRLFEPRGPLVNSEFYPGWLDHWQSKHSKVASRAVSKALDAMLQLGANVNIYMFHGGTSFGLTAGSNFPPFQATPTSYDYDAPVSESGDLTEKYWSVRKVVGKYSPLPPIPSHLENYTQKADYGAVKMRYVCSIFNPRNTLLKPLGSFVYPVSFEDVSQFGGLILYQTKVKSLHSDPALLSIPGLRDRGYIFINERFVGILSREVNSFSASIQIMPDDNLQIVVENQGRICFGASLMDRKGIISNVTLDGSVLTNWNLFGIPLEVSGLHKFVAAMLQRFPEEENQLQNGGRMSLWFGEFVANTNSIEAGQPRDTFVRLPGWSKGIVAVNDILLGRYWPKTGPQVTLYLPGAYLLPPPKVNRIIVFEQDGLVNTNNTTVQLVDSPQIDGPTPKY